MPKDPKFEELKNKILAGKTCFTPDELLEVLGPRRKSPNLSALQDLLRPLPNGPFVDPQISKLDLLIQNGYPIEDLMNILNENNAYNLVMLQKFSAKEKGYLDSYHGSRNDLVIFSKRIKNTQLHIPLLDSLINNPELKQYILDNLLFKKICTTLSRIPLNDIYKIPSIQSTEELSNFLENKDKRAAKILSGLSNHPDPIWSAAPSTQNEASSSTSSKKRSSTTLLEDMDDEAHAPATKMRKD